MVARVARATYAYRYHGGVARGKLELSELEAAREATAALVGRAASIEQAPATASEYPYVLPGDQPEATEHLLVRGRRARSFLHAATTGDLLSLEPGPGRIVRILDPEGAELATAAVVALPDDEVTGHQRALLQLRSGQAEPVVAWLRALSDGTARFDDDLYRKVPGPVTIEALAADDELVTEASEALDHSDSGESRTKGWFVGERAVITATDASAPTPPPPFDWAPADGEPRRTPMYDLHAERCSKGQIANFAGWLLPVYFTSIRDEHRKVRTAAGLFDVAHMGVLEVAGAGAERFIDLVTTNTVSRLKPGKAQYSYLLAPDGRVIDDILVYRRAPELFMVVVNAANAEEDEAWLRAVLERRVQIDLKHPTRALEVDCRLRNLKDPACGDDQRVDTALQGPRSYDIIAELIADASFRDHVRGLRPFEFAEGELGGLPTIVSRTGYTGEPLGYELYVHPEAMPRLWEQLLEAGERWNLALAGLGARDTTRTEAGLPLHGHELAGDHGVSPIEAGYGGFVKLHKAWFVGRDAMVEQHRRRQRRILRFQVSESGGRMLRPGAPVVDAKRGKVVGTVTSCAKVDEIQVGLAIAPAKLDEPGARVDVFPLPPRVPPAKKVDELDVGDAVALPRQAVVVSRFLRNE